MDYERATAIKNDILASYPPEQAAIILGQRFSADPDFFDALHNREIASGVHISNPGPDASTMSSRYQEGVAGAAGRWVHGMSNPRRDPQQAAIRAAGKWANRVTVAIQEKRFEAGVRQYNLAEAVATAVSDGGSAYTAGAAKRVAKVERAFARLAPLLAGVSTVVQNMPQDTEPQREARLLQALRSMRNVGKAMRGQAVR